MTEKLPDAPTRAYALHCTGAVAQIVKSLGLLNNASIKEIQRTKQAAEAIGMARCFVHLRQAKDAIDEAMKQLNKTFEIMKTRDYPEMLEVRKLPHVALADLGQQVGSSARTSVKMHDKDSCISYLINYQDEQGDHPFRDLPQMSVAAQTLSATAREMAEQGEAFPEFGVNQDGERISLFQTTLLTTTTMRKIAKKKD